MNISMVEKISMVFFMMESYLIKICWYTGKKKPDKAGLLLVLMKTTRILLENGVQQIIMVIGLAKNN